MPFGWAFSIFEINQGLHLLFVKTYLHAIYILNPDIVSSKRVAASFNKPVSDCFVVKCPKSEKVILDCSLASPCFRQIHFEFFKQHDRNILKEEGFHFHKRSEISYAWLFCTHYSKFWLPVQISQVVFWKLIVGNRFAGIFLWSLRSQQPNTFSVWFHIQ